VTRPTLENRQSSQSDQVGTWAGTLAIAEVGIGSMLHGLHVPLTGTFLSLNQGLFLSRITKLNQHQSYIRTLGFEVSSVTALLKSFSPVGKRLTPMLAIASQGFLFTLGVMIFGANILGVVIGSVFLAIWGIIQPLILAGVMVTTLTDAEKRSIYAGWQKMTAEISVLSSFSLLDAISLLLATKCLLAATLALVAWRTPLGKPTSLLSRWESFINRQTPPLSMKSIHSDQSADSNLLTHMHLAFKDVRNPLVVGSALLLATLSYFLDSEFIGAVWIGMRALAGAYVVYLLLRLLPWDKWLNPENKNTRALRSAIIVIQGRRAIPDGQTTMDPPESKT